MKRIIATLVIMGGIFATSYAANLMTSKTLNNDNSIMAVQDEYVTVKMENLPELIQSAIKTLVGETFDIQLLEFNQTKEYTRVTLINKTDKTTKVVILDKEGKEVVEGETQEKEEEAHRHQSSLIHVSLLTITSEGRRPVKGSGQSW